MEAPRGAGKKGRARRPAERSASRRGRSATAWQTIESVSHPRAANGLVAGGQELEGSYDLVTPVAHASLHTSKGVGYKPWNEDGGALFADRSGRIYAGVFDQAGGMGHAAGDPGGASRAAGACFFSSMQSLANGAQSGVAEAGNALYRAAKAAHNAILGRDYFEATTSVGAVIDGRNAVLLNVGDSRAFHVGRGGEILDSTRPHRLPPPFPQNVLTEALGQRDHEPAADLYRWTVAPGEHLIFGSDGLFECGLSEEDVARIVAEAPSPAAATARLRDEAYARMRDRRGKRDNLTILVVRIQGQVESLAA